jgi:PAS domain S-box-containing protein
VAASSDESRIGLDKSTDAIFLGGQKNTFIKDVYYSETYKEPLMAVSSPLLDSNTGEFLGVIAARVRLNDLNNIVTNKTGMGQTGEIYIVNKYGFMITPSRFTKDAVLKQRVDTENARRARLHKGIEHALSEEEEETGNVFSDYRGVQVLGTHTFIPQMKWAVLAEINTKEAFAPLAKLRLLFFLILFIAVNAAWLSGISIARFISEPIHKLHKGTEIIGSGNLDYKVGTDAKDEVGQLSRAFDTMTENLKNTTTSIESLNKEIAYRRKAETESLKFAKEWSETFDAMSDAVSIQSDDFVILNANAAFIKIFNKTKEEIIGRKCFELVHCKNAPIEGCPFKKAKSTQKNEYVETFEPTLGIWVAVSTSPIFDEQGNIKKVIHIMRNITERKQAEEALKESEEKYKTLYESSQDAIMILTAEKGFISGNPATLKLFGCEDEKEFTTLTPADLSPEYQPDGTASSVKAQEMMKTAMEKGSHFFEWVHKRMDGTEFDATVLLTRIELKGEKVLQATVRDITDSKKAEKEMKEAVEMKSTFISTASHELRTPLTSIKEGLNLVYSETTGPLNDDQKEFLGIAKRNVDRLARLINDVLDYQKMTAGRMDFNMKSASINKAVTLVEETMRPLTKEKGLDFIIELDQAIPAVNFDEDKIIQVLTNLVNNAIKFTETGSIKITTSRGDNNIITAVKDTGDGIKQEDVPRLFQEFEQLVTKDNYRKTGGTGLGLVISKKIIENHGGRIWAESEYGKGTTFYFELPMEAIPCQIKS